jgi:hypothetical protein
MNWTKISTLVLFIVALVLAYYLFSRIKFAIDEEKRIVAHENAVIAKLTMIREGELAYLSVNGQYTDNWDSLSKFMQTGDFYIIQRTETIITLSYGADSSVVHLDTLNTVKVYDSLFSEVKYPNLNFDRLMYIPGTDNKIFEIFADVITKGGVSVNVLEVRDTAPENPIRKETNEARNKKPLRFGSRTDVTTAGNWE